MPCQSAILMENNVLLDAIGICSRVGIVNNHHFNYLKYITLLIHCTTGAHAASYWEVGRVEFWRSPSGKGTFV